MLIHIKRVGSCFNLLTDTKTQTSSLQILEELGIDFKVKSFYHSNDQIFEPCILIEVNDPDQINLVKVTCQDMIIKVKHE